MMLSFDSERLCRFLIFSIELIFGGIDDKNGI